MSQLQSTEKLPLKEKMGYALGDAAANLVWRGALAYLAFFYTDTFGLTAAAAALLILLVRLSDGVTDIAMGMIADRTETRWGKYRPWILWSSPILAVFMVLCFTTPDWSDSAKLIYAYVTYIGLTLAYTLNNVPYSSLMGVMTASETERTELSGFRFFGAFLGGLLVMGFLPDLVAWFGQGNDQQGYQYTMYLFAVLLLLMMLATFATTKERVQPPQSQEKQSWKEFAGQLLLIMLPLLVLSVCLYYLSIWTGLVILAMVVCGVVLLRRATQKGREHATGAMADVLDLLTNKPWLILLLVGFLFMMFNGIKYAVIAYYFKYFIGSELLVGRYFVFLLIVSMLGALVVPFISSLIGKRALFILCLLGGAFFSILMFWIPASQVNLIFAAGCAAEVFAAMMPVLFFTMLGDAADYSEWKNGRRATGLFYSAGTFINKTGSGIAVALVLLILAHDGYDAADEASAMNAVESMVLLMSWIPSVFAILAAVAMCFYPLHGKLSEQISKELAARRVAAAE